VLGRASAGRRGGAEGCEVTPFVGFIERVNVVGGVELGGAISQQEGPQRGVDERCVG
jgi:hypothetical protein